MTALDAVTADPVGALQGCTLVEVDLDEAGQYAGRLLARLGARVIKFEGYDGDRTRRLPAFVRDRDGRRRSLPFEYFNTGKESIALDLDDVFAMDLLVRLVDATARRGRGDVVVLVSPRMAARIPEAVRAPVLVAGAYGGSGPQSHLPTTPLTRFHAGGNGYLVPGDDADRFRPTQPGTFAAECFAGNGIAVAVLGMILMRHNDPGLAAVPQVRADWSQMAYSINLEKMFLARTSHEGVELTRATHRYPFGGAMRCKDGYVSMLINEMHQWHALCGVIGKPEWAHDKAYAGGGGRWAMQDTIRPVLDAWCGARTVDEVLEATRAVGVPMGRIRTIGEVLTEPSFRQRGFLGEADTPYGKVADIGHPYGKVDPMWRPAGRPFAPLLGEHSGALLAELGHTAEDITLFENLGLVRCEGAPSAVAGVAAGVAQ